MKFTTAPRIGRPSAWPMAEFIATWTTSPAPAMNVNDSKPQCMQFSGIESVDQAE